MFCAAGAMRRPRISERAIRRSARSDRSEEHTSELQSQSNLVCRLLLEKKNSHSLRTSTRVIYAPSTLMAAIDFSAPRNSMLNVRMIYAEAPTHCTMRKLHSSDCILNTQ